MSIQFQRISLRRMIVVPIILLVLLSVFLVGYFSMRNSRLAVTSVSSALRDEITDRIQNRAIDFLDAPQTVCILTANLIRDGFLNQNDPRQMEQWFLNLILVHHEISSICFGNPEGGIADAGVETSGEFYKITTENYQAGMFYKYRVDRAGNRLELLIEIPEFDARNRFWFTMATESPGSVVRTDPYTVFTGDDIAISTSCSVNDQQGDFAGVVTCDIFLSNLDEFLGSIQIGKTGLAFITDREGRVLASSTHSALEGKISLLPASVNENYIVSCVGLYIDSLYGNISAIDSIIEFDLEFNSASSFVQVSPFQDSLGKSYYIVTSIPETDFMEFIAKSKRDTDWLLGISLMIALIIGILVARLIARQIHDLRSTVKDMIDGQQTEFSPHWMKEVNELSTDISHLIGRLNSTMEDLKKSEERMQLSLRGTKAAIWDWDLSSGEIKTNERWAEMLGYTLDEIEPITEKSWNELLHPDDIEETYLNLKDHLEGGKDLYEASFRLKHKDGSWIWVMDSGMVLEWDNLGKPLRMAGTHIDISLRKTAEIEQVRLQIQISKARELESIGKLAGGVAHDLNNLLTPIIGYTELLLADADSETDTTPFREILRAGRSSKKLVNQLLAFGRKQFLQIETIDLNEVVINFKSLLTRTIRENISISFNLHDSPLPVRGDTTRLEQVLMNLAVNAQDAMPDGGELHIYTAPALSPHSSQNHSALGDCAILVISDNGIGMSSETVEKIFEPFFSTKGENGTGLGLATVYGIVAQHEGIVAVESELGVGTTFRIFLPISEEAVLKSERSTKPVSIFGNETILVVEDSDEVRDIAVIALERFGYKVLKATCGSDALDIIREKGDTIDLLLTDVIMPGISLDELCREALKAIPGLKIIYMSGYSGDIFKRDMHTGKTVPFISKPFSLSGLAEIVKSVFSE